MKNTRGWEATNKSLQERAEHAAHMARQCPGGVPKLFGQDAAGRYLYATAGGTILRGGREEFSSRRETAANTDGRVCI